jgi:hypothetical protein
MEIADRSEDPTTFTNSSTPRFHSLSVNGRRACTSISMVGGAWAWMMGESWKSFFSSGNMEIELIDLDVVVFHDLDVAHEELVKL